MTDLVLGKGRLYFERFLLNTKRRSGEGFGYFGNTPELTVTTEEEKLEHFSSEGGLNVKDASVTISSTRSGGFTTDHMSPENLVLWYRGSKKALTQAASVANVDTWPAAKRGNYFQLGETTGQEQGVRKVKNLVATRGVDAATGTVTFSVAAATDGDSVTVNGRAYIFRDLPTGSRDVATGATIAESATNLADTINGDSLSVVEAVADAAVVTLTSDAKGASGNAYTLSSTGANIAVSAGTLAGGTEEELDELNNLTILAETGLVRVKPDAPDITDGDALTFTYDTDAAALAVIVDGSQALEGRMMFVSDNPVGENKDHLWPYVQLSSDGDYSLIGEEWQSISFTYEVLKLDEDTDREIITNRGKATSATG